MPTLDESYPGIVAALTDRYGRRDAFSTSNDPFENVVGAFLAGTTSRVSEALEALREAGLLAPDRLANADPTEIGEALQSALVKARPPTLVTLRRLARWVADQSGDKPDGPIDLDDRSTEDLREQLRSLRGIGPASAETILLHGLRRAAYPVDRASYRILIRHGWLDLPADEDEARSVLQRLAPDDPNALAELSAGFESVGREYCRASVPRCERCPLRPFLPEGGPREPDGS